MGVHRDSFIPFLIIIAASSGKEDKKVEQTIRRLEKQVRKEIKTCLEFLRRIEEAKTATVPVEWCWIRV